MSVSNGWKFLSIPGPTNVPDEVLAAMHRPAEDIYRGELPDISDDCHARLKTIFRTKDNVYIYAANGHGAWEAALSNTLSRGDKVLVLESGRFAVGWGETAAKMGAEMEILPGSWRAAVDPDSLEARSRTDKTGEIKAILVAQIDTASGIVNDIPALRRAIDNAGHTALFMVDTVASLACMPFAMDEWQVDIAVSGSQKGLMVPPGLGFVAASTKARKAHEAADMTTFYWDWTFREGPEHYMKYCGTPPEHLLFGLNHALSMIFDEGLDYVIKRHSLLAGATHAAVTEWAKGGALNFNVITAEHRAASITGIRLNDHDPKPILDYARETCGTVIGQGIGDLADEMIRIAHMGHCNAPMLLGTLAVTQMALQALNIPHGRNGVTEAINYLAANA